MSDPAPVDPDSSVQRQPLLRCAVELVDLVRALFTDMFQLPVFVSSYVAVVGYVLALFLEKVRWSYVAAVGYVLTLFLEKVRRSTWL